MVNPTYFINFKKVGGSLLRGTRGLLHGGLPKLACVMQLDKRVGWCSASIWSKSEPIGPTLDNVAGECAELKCPVELVDNPEWAGPPKS